MATSSSSALTSSTLLRSAGLMSGLDTEAIVKQMASNTKLKINKQQQSIDKLTWKQESYRDVISKIQSFQSKYFDSLKPETNIGSQSLMGAYKAASSNPLVTATASTSATAATYKITDIEQLATAAKLTSQSGAISAGVRLNMSGAAEGTSYTVAVTLDGAKKDVTFTGGADTAQTQQNFLSALNAKLGSTVTRDGTSYTNGFEISADGLVTYVDSSDSTLGHNFTIGASDNSTLDAQDAAMSAVGLNVNTSNTLNVGNKLSDVMFSTELQGGSYNFVINGEEFSFNGNSTVRDVINTINSSEAGITVSFSSLSRSFELTSNSEGAGSAIEITQTSGNLLNAIFGDESVSGIAEGSATSSVSFMSSSLKGNRLGSPTDYINTPFDVTVNGVTKEIGLYAYDFNGNKYDYSEPEKIAEALNQELIREFGSSAPTFTYSEEDIGFTFKAAGTSDIVSFSAVDGYENSANLLTQLGFSDGLTNAVESSAKIGNYSGELTFDGGSLTLTSDTTIQDLVDAGLVTYNADTGVMTAVKDFSAGSDASAFMSEIFNAQENGGLYTVTGTTSEQYQTTRLNGQNAILNVNGVRMTYSSNSIEIDGTTINIGGLTQDAIDGITAGSPLTVTTGRDTEKAFDAVVKFVADYNDLITQLNSSVSTTRPKSGGAYYEPLTAEQKEDMSEDEIEKWEEKAKTGMLYQDSYINNFLTKLRGSLSAYTVDGFSLYDMGITVSSTTADRGKLTVNEQTLRQAFEEHPDQIQKLFTDQTGGIASKVTSALNSAISTSRVNGYGTLVTVAGVTNTASAGESSITKQLERYQTILDSLNTRYDNEMERYWDKFTQLEVAMSNYSAQSSLFTQATG